MHARIRVDDTYSQEDDGTSNIDDPLAYPATGLGSLEVWCEPEVRVAWRKRVRHLAPHKHDCPWHSILNIQNIRRCGYNGQVARSVCVAGNAVCTLRWPVDTKILTQVHFAAQSELTQYQTE